MNSSKRKLAAFVALAYMLIIVYASLQPFQGWRTPPDEVLAFLTAPWPRYITAGDVMLNIVAYLPLGAILFIALRPPLASVSAFVAATLIAATLSLALESVQMFLPSRIASNVDLLANSAGAGSGALAVWIFSLPAVAKHPLVAMRRHALRSDALGDCGLIVVALWILIQFHQAPLALGSGDVRENFGITPFFSHTPQSYLMAEAGVAALAIVAIGLLVSLLMKPERPAAPAIALTLALALVAKTIAAIIMARSANWLQWLTPGVAAGIVGGIVLLMPLSRLGHVARGVAAVLCVVAGVAIVNVAPENPYQSVPNFMLVPQPTHLVNFSHIVHALSQLWPLLAALCIAALARCGPAAADLTKRAPREPTTA
jgi:VanZ family protein